MVPNITCPCSEIIMKSEPGVSKIRSKILILKDNSAYAICKSCGFEVKVPLKIDDSFDNYGPDLVLEE